MEAHRKAAAPCAVYRPLAGRKKVSIPLTSGNLGGVIWNFIDMRGFFAY
jgi:hypothetical protein